MVLEYGAKNFFCFKDWLDVDMSFNDNVPQSVSHGNRAAPVLCFKGANAAGKTNALKALAFIADFCLNSFSYNPDAPMAYNTYFNNDDVPEFFINFVTDGRKYTYELVVDRKSVISEVLKDKKRLSCAVSTIELHARLPRKRLIFCCEVMRLS